MTIFSVCNERLSKPAKPPHKGIELILVLTYVVHRVPPCVCFAKSVAGAGGVDADFVVFFIVR